tara:strand:- start:683 stop:937 length:255 start_codon:yes stop_codon:yes gene_type:complete
MSPSRHAVRSNRRKQIDSILRHEKSIQGLTDAIRIMPADLRATCVLDLEEFLHTKDAELAAQNSWWSQINLKKLWESLRRNSLA